MFSNVKLPSTIDHNNTLKNLGLSENFFNLITERVLTAYTQTTKHDALIAKGMYAYLAAVRAIRDILKPHGWETHREGNLEMIKNDDSGITIMVSSSDHNTGYEKGPEPETKNSKGEQTQRVVLQNGLLFPEFEKELLEKNKDLNPVWIYLYHIDEMKSEVRTELALPFNMRMKDGKLKINKWQTRIILPVFKFNKTATPMKESEFTPDIDIEIKRRINK